MRFISTRCIVLFSLVLFFLSQSSFAQSTSEDDVKKQAQKYFDAGDFTSALPLYSQLLSFYAKDPNYNFRYGVCALEAGNDREKPISYLEFASKNKEVSNDVFYYLGKAYHLNYRFSSALNAYNTYKIKATKADQDKFQVDRQLEMCRNGMELLKNISDLTVMDKKELKLTDYFRAYDLSAIGLKLLVKPDDFKTTFDKKKNEESVIVLNPNKSEIYFSSYGDNDKNGKDIYKVKKMSNGEWSNPLRLENSINTAYDEDFPFLSNDGTTLYFCSKGHNSMGGYDVFKSTYNTANATWGQPENMDFAINTPDDDILYIADEVNKVAYFSSRRTSGQGNINVYKIVVGPKPPAIALISGVFSTTDENTHPEATITIRDSESKNIIGVFKSDPKTGNYSIPLPSSGTYIFNVESEISAMKTETVIVPEKQDLGTLQQKISVKGDKLSIENIFADAAINEANLMALLKAKANLEVNYVAEVKTAPVVEEPKKNNLSNQDLVNIAYQDAKDTKAEADQLRLKSDQAYALSKSKMDLSKGKLFTADNIEKSAQNIASEQEKANEIDKVNQLKKEAKSNTLQAYAIYAIAKNLEEDANNKQAEADQSLNYAKELDNAIQINSKESIARLTTQKNNITETTTNKNIAEAASGDLTEQAENRQQEADAAQSRSKIVLTEILDIDLKTETLSKDKASATDAKATQDINNQLEDLRLEKVEKQKRLQENYAAANQLQQEADDLKSQSEFIAAAINDLKSGSHTLPAPTAQEKITLGNELAIDLGRANAVAKVEEKPLLQANNSDINDNEADAFITTDIGNTPVTADNFNIKIAQANKITDSVKREEQKNKVRSQMNINWEKDISNLKTQQANSKDKNVRANMQSRITELEHLKAMNTPTPEVALTTAAEIKATQAETSKTAVDTTALAVNSTKSKDANTAGTANTTTSSAPIKTLGNETANSGTTVKQTAANSENPSAATTTVPANENKVTGNEPLKTGSASNSTTNSDSAVIALNTNTPSNEIKTGGNEAATTPKATPGNPENAANSTTSTIPVNKNTTTATETAAVASEPVNADKLEEDYDLQYTLVSQIVDVNEKAKANQKLAESWVKVTDEKIATVTAQLVKASNSEDIATLNSTVKELQDLKTKISTAAPSNALATTTSASNAPASTKEAVEPKPIGTPVNTNNSSITDNTNAGAVLKNEPNRNSVSEANFSSEQAKTQARKADRLNAEAAQLKINEDSLSKVLAATTDSSEKRKVEKQLAATQADVYVKHLDALKAYSVANNVEFNGNTEQLKKAGENTKGVDSDNISRAEMLVAEAAYYYNEANIKSDLNIAVTDAAVKETEMKKIVELEKTAIEKQRRALTTYGVPVGLASNKNTFMSPSTIMNASSTNTGNTTNKESATENTNATQNPTASIVQQNSVKTAEAGNTANSAVNTNEKTKSAKDSTSSLSQSTSTTQPENARAAELLSERERAFVYPTDTMLSPVKLDKAAFDSIAGSSYYNYYNTLLIEATSNMQQSGYYESRGSSLKKQAFTDSLAAEDYILQASKTTDTLQMQQLISKAAESTYKSNQNKEHADSSYNVARRLSVTAADNKSFAARYVSRLSESDKNNLVAIMNYNEGAKEKPLTPTAIAAGTIQPPIKSDLLLAKKTETKETVQTKKETRIAADSALNKSVAQEEKTVAANQLLVNNKDLVSTEDEKQKNTPALSNAVNAKNELIKEVVFSKAGKGVYSRKNPIPINALLPSGVIFKVQIGAFRKPIPQDLFKGFDPINGETSANGITRYTAGYFKNFEAANSVKKEINGIGYKDAFVVAFCNGKRISVPEATAMIREGKTCGGELIAENKEAFKTQEKPVEITALPENSIRSGQNIDTSRKTETMPVESVSSQLNQTRKEETPAEPIAPSVSFEEVKGLVYTVQVGVYSKPILANQLFNIQPLYFERTTTGLYRYTSGIFDNLETAGRAKANIIAIGVKDAFVTTYFNGSRIPVEQAKKLEAEQGKSVFAISTNLNKMPETNANAKITGLGVAVPTVRIEKSNVHANEQSGTNKIVLPVEGLKNQAGNAIIFKVQIGVFRSEVPLEIAAIFLKLSTRGIEHYQTSDSLTIYTIGNLRDISSANNLKDEVIQEGLPDAFVVAFKAGNKMKIEDAIKEVSKK